MTSIDYNNIGLRSGSLFWIDCRASLAAVRLQHRSAVVQLFLLRRFVRLATLRDAHRQLVLPLFFEADRLHGDSVPVDYRPWTGIRSALRKVRANRVLRGVASLVQSDIFGGVAAGAWSMLNELIVSLKRDSLTVQHVTVTGETGACTILKTGSLRMAAHETALSQ